MGKKKNTKKKKYNPSFTHTTSCTKTTTLYSWHVYLSYKPKRQVLSPAFTIREGEIQEAK